MLPVDDPELAPLEEQQHITEQINPTAIASSPTQEDWYWGRLATGGEEDYYWRRLSDNWYQKDVIPSTFLELLNACYEAYNANPLAFAIVEMTTNFVLGKQITVQCKHKKVQKVVDAFWNDPNNRMDMRVYLICTELSLYGEQFIRFFINPYNGSIYIRQIDPALIDQVETDPDDIEHELRYHRRPIGPSATLPGDPAPVLPKDDAAFNGEWFSTDDVAHFCINKVSNAKRGHSDLATLLPWLRRYKDWLTDRVRINKYKGAFLWDVTLKGADDKTVRRKSMDYSYPPEPGTVIFHNDAEQWTAVQPQINANDAYQDGRAIKMMVAVGSGLPEHYLSDGSEGNQATATQMALPTLLKFQRRQKSMDVILHCILDRVIAEAKKAGTLPVGASDKYDIIFPELDAADNQLVGTGLSYLMQAMTAAKGQGWISDETAMTLMYKFANVEINVQEEMDRIRSQVPNGPLATAAEASANASTAAAQLLQQQQPGQPTQKKKEVPLSQTRSVHRDPAKATLPAAAM